MLASGGMFGESKARKRCVLTCVVTDESVAALKSYLGGLARIDAAATTWIVGEAHNSETRLGPRTIRFGYHTDVDFCRPAAAQQAVVEEDADLVDAVARRED